MVIRYSSQRPAAPGLLEKPDQGEPHLPLLARGGFEGLAESRHVLDRDLDSQVEGLGVVGDVAVEEFVQSGISVQGFRFETTRCAITEFDAEGKILWFDLEFSRTTRDSLLQAIQVALGEISGMLGLKGGGHGTLQKIWNDIQQIDQINLYALGTALAVLVIIVGSKKISKKIPGALIAVVGAIVASWALNLGAHVHVLGEVPSGLPHIGLPEVEWSWELIGKLVPTAFAMFVVILAQSAATSRAYAARYNERFSENTDLVGLGLANIGAGLSGTFVVNGSPTKTQMVDSAGGRSQLSLLFTTAIVLLVLLFLTGPLAYMPEAVLSAVVFLIGIDLIDIQGMKRIYAQRRSEFWVALITTLMVVFVGVEQGIILAIVLFAALVAPEVLVSDRRNGIRVEYWVYVARRSATDRPFGVPERVMVDAANVIKTDIETTNGVIHVIDTVILPRS